jgi:hypothetical protein
MNGEIFLTCLEKCLVPTLSPGEIVSMESLPAHKVAGVREMIEAAGATLWLLPPYPQTSIQSNSPSPNSRPITEAPENVQFPLSGIARKPRSGKDRLG